MLSAAALLMIGYFIIDANNLYSDTHDFEGHGGGIAAWVDNLHLLPLPMNLIGVRMLAGYFIASGAATYGFAKQGDYVRHRRWAIRHVGAGLWVSAQRPFYAVVRLAQAALFGTQTSMTTTAEADAFYYAAYTTTLVYVFASEWLARRPANAATGAVAIAPTPSTSTPTSSPPANLEIFSIEREKCAAEAQKARNKASLQDDKKI